MGLFDNLRVATKITTESISKAATNAVNTVVTASKETAKINSLKTELTAINGELDAAYKQIGEKFVEYVLTTNEMPGINVENILKLMEPKLEKKKELEIELIEIEKRLKDQVIIQEKAQLENEFRQQKETLDKAIAMDIISQEEYNSKIEQFRRKIDNFEAIRNVKKQHELGIISYDELHMKLRELS
ncbi:hypothetical protein [Clostridium cylindrosporum]|uniref:Uncharacterized protein n=1 Tax=Clostridium cylindrosporum DSM 605 TaxID=1121307 RepID=A0A0J8DCB5_CLOCY|nr:hypothetical protein [Clostridium cylindrosporum]KMT21898.1 hypothetical protein CLCY_3c01690 [Clostridium cylindrosporum DSM 605]